MTEPKQKGEMRMKPYIESVSVVASKGKFGVVLDVVHKDRTLPIVDAVEDSEEQALRRATELCRLWGLEVKVVAPKKMGSQN